PDLAKAGISVPFVSDLASTEDDKKLLDMFIRPAILGRPFITSNKIAPKDLATLRTAFDATMKDPELLAEAKQLGWPVTPISGLAAQKMVQEIYEIPQPIVDRALGILQ